MPADHPLRVLVADDEPLARQRIEDLLRGERGVTIVGTADSGPATIDAIRSTRPDLVFLDVQMPGVTGLDVVRALGGEMPLTIFVTAYDRHAIEAFDLAAVDYLVKPYDDERFEQALARARRRLELEEVARLREQLLAALGGAPAPSPAPPPQAGGDGWLERIPVESRGKVRVVPAAEVDYIVSDGPYAELHVGDRRHIIREAMQTLEERLDPARFLRIHRSAIVQLDRIDSLLRQPNGDVEVQLKNGVKLRVSRSRREELERRLGL
jgi:two-component system, LytTR family, response regulator